MLLVSACLAGMQCRYNGKANLKNELYTLVKNGKAIPLCPEMLGGLSTPRCPCEQKNIDGKIKIIGNDGNDYTEAFTEGAKITLAIAKSMNIKTAILQEKSPSCGIHKVHDGSFEDQLIDGIGLTSKLLKANGIEVLTYDEYVGEEK